MNDWRVDVETQFVVGDSDPRANRYVFAYTITISNSGHEVGQLLNRHWRITDGSGEVQEVQGPGVIGKQPRIKPGEMFRYTSAAVLKTPVGAMQGTYEFQREGGELFEVPIPVFSLSVPNMVH
ncbi:MAG: Co2+/Mg2+ efflux protein ApaG [Proteobacteria bacterium]|nr:Co2+/Mg2+ efflux protein ApaG [Pseudomonadota bacterium]